MHLQQRRKGWVGVLLFMLVLLYGIQCSSCVELVCQASVSSTIPDATTTHGLCNMTTVDTCSMLCRTRNWWRLWKLRQQTLMHRPRRCS